ncbi:MAG: tRNA threonylcarbamoyladenosine dehydratase [Armatimonadota bacterium]
MVSWNERFSRIELMLGSGACERLRQSSVTVVGLGAVGTYAVEGLARAGIGRLRLIDFDKISPSNINRQLYALGSTIGRLKCDVAVERVLDINPDCKVEAIDGFLDEKTVRQLVGESPDLVIDAIDSLNPKVELLSSARSRDLPVISCLGAALRTDPSYIRTAPISEVKSCPLGRAVKKRLRNRGTPLDILSVFSEEPLPNPLPIAMPTERLGEEPFLKRGRVRNTLGSLPTITGMFGLIAANLGIRILIEKDREL